MQPQSETEDSQQPVSSPIKAKANARLASDVWGHFTKFFKEGSKKADHAKCNYCKTTYAWISADGTSTLIKHATKCMKNPSNKEDKKQKLLNMHSIVEGGREETSNSINFWKFDQQTCKEALAKMVIKDELPFRFVECQGFREFCSVMKPNFKTCSCITVGRDCVAIYNSEKKKLKTSLIKSGQMMLEFL